MSEFAKRRRLSEDAARREIGNYRGPRIVHLLVNEDATFSIMSHIVCEHCDYCEEQGDCRGRPDVQVVPQAKEDPYEIVGR